MSEGRDGSWDAPTEHDDRGIDPESDHGELAGDDPPTVRASDAHRARVAREAAIASRLANVNVNANVVAKAPSATLPPPPAQRQPAQRQPAPPAPARAPTTGATKAVGFDTDSVVVLDRVSTTMIDHAPNRSESAAGGIVVVATGSDADRVRKLCHKHGLLVPVMASLAVVHDAMSIVVIGEPSPPAPERVVHVVRPTLADADLLDLLRALATGHVVVDPPKADAPDGPDARIREAAQRLTTLTDRAAIEATTIDTIATLTSADRAHCLFHDPSTGALWSEARRRRGGDDRHAMGGLVGWAAQTGQSIHASPAGDDPRWLQELDDPDGKRQSRLLVQPIIGGDRRVHAVLVVVRRWSHADFSAQDIAALASFAALAGPTLDLAVAASPAGPRKPRATMPGVATSASALMSPRASSDSRPPPVTARKPGSETAPVPMATKQPAAHLLPVVDSPRGSQPPPDERYSSDSIASLPTPPSMPARASVPPKPTTQPVATIDKRTGPAAVADQRTGPVRMRTSSDSPPQKHRPGEPRDLAVIANDDDAKRVQRVAKKLRLELLTFPTIADAPDFYRVVTLGDTWSGNDARVAYAARSTITDEQLGDLLVALIQDRAVAPAAPISKPQTAAEARRSQLGFAGARKLAAITDLTDAEPIVTSTINDLLDTDRAYFWCVDPDTGALWSETRKRASGDARHAIAGIAGWVARTGRGANVPRASADPRWLGPIDDPDGDPHSQLLMQPLVRADDRVHGVLIAARRARRPGFTDTDAALFARFATLVTPLLEQIEVAAQAQQMLGEETAARSPQATAPDSPLAAILRGTHPLARWVYLALGLAVGLALGLLL